MLAARKPPSCAVVKRSLAVPSDSSGYAYAHRIIYTVCCLAGCSSFVDDARDELVNNGVLNAIEAHNTPVLFDWMVRVFSFQGIANTIAADYMDRHGSLTWGAIAADLDDAPACPKLQNYWQFHDCGYGKGSGTCNEPELLSGCPLPKHPLRNGRLNQTAYGLFLFIRDIADGDLVAWIDRQLADADDRTDPDRIIKLAENLVGPLRHIHGVADKVLMMTLASLLLASNKPTWTEVGASMIAIDTLVHNFLHRTGILHRLGANHPYGAACYRPTGCADIIRTISARIDARPFNRTFPQAFPRFVQHAVWRYCAQDCLNICNGNRIDDRQACQNRYCQLYLTCDRKPLM
jgi:hypothetical protein